MGQAAPDEEIVVSDNKKTIINDDIAWNKFQKTLWVYYTFQWIWFFVFIWAFYVCAQENFTIQELWLKLSFEPLTHANINTVSGDYLLILLLGMPLMLLFFTRVLKHIIRKPTFSLLTYNISSVIRVLWFVFAGHLAGYILGGIFLCSMIYLNQILKKT